MRPIIWSKIGKVHSRIQVGGPSLQPDLSEFGPGNYTVQFSVGNVTPGTANVNPVAEINWAIGGNQVTRKISVFNGASISGVCEALSVKVFDESPDAEGSPTQVYDVGVLIGPGVRSSTNLPPVYIFEDGRIDAPAAGTASMTIPTGIGITSIFITAHTSDGSALTGGDAEVQQLDMTGAILKAYDPRNYEFVPVSPMAKTIKLINHIGGGGANIIFSLTYGIDG